MKFQHNICICLAVQLLLKFNLKRKGMDENYPKWLVSADKRLYNPGLVIGKKDYTTQD